MVLHKPRDANSPMDETATNQTQNETVKKSSNITATTSNARTSELDSMRKMSRDQTTISSADETGKCIFVTPFNSTKFCHTSG